MKEIIPIFRKHVGEGEVNAVDARELHAFLESGQQFSDWIVGRIRQYGFAQDVDFITIHNSMYSPPRKEYYLTLDMAKELAMVERNDKGKEARQYFIECERRARNAAPALPKDYTEALRHLLAKSEECDKQAQQIEQDKPKVLFADSVSASKSSILVRDLAKLLKQNGHEIGEKRLFQWLRENGFLIKAKGRDYNSPTQRAMEMNLFEIRETSINRTNGIFIQKTSLVTGKGQRYFLERLLHQEPAIA